MKRIYLIFFVVLGLLGSSLYGQERRVTGTVTQFSDGSSLPGVTVRVQGTTLGTITDMNGRYEITVAGNGVLVFSYIGMNTEEVQVNNRNIIDVAMVSDVSVLQEIVVVGYGVQRKSEVTGAISQVRGAEIAGLATPSFDAQLAGRAAGVQVTTTSGILGVAPRIRVRGVGSISSGTYPLVVVDGMPIFTGDLGGYADNNALGDINPGDIESIEILKDGAATAIYGSRAANGVILITTKRGSRGKFRMTYNNYLGVAAPVKLFDLLNAQESILINNEKRTNRTQTAIAFAEGTNPVADTDWQQEVLNTRAFQQDHNLSLSGANENTNYYFSLGYTAQEGIARPNEMSRFSLRANVDQKVARWLNIGANVGITQSEYFGLNTGENSLSGNIFSAIRQLPNTPVYNPAHPTGYNIDFVSPGFVGRWNNTATIGDNLPNIVYVINNNRFNTKTFRTIANTYASVNILPSLNFRTQLSADAALTEGLLYYNPFHGDGQSSKGRVNNNYANSTRWTYQNVLTYSEQFADVHNVAVTLVSEFQKQRLNSFFAAGTDLASPFFQYNLVSGSFGTPTSGGGLTENGFISYAGRINYNYDGKYLLQGSVRYDAISSMPADNRYGLFPGGSVGWAISREGFWESLLPIVNDFKVRASYAEVGNTAIGNYPYAGLYGVAKYGDNNGIAFSQMGNYDLRWETSKKLGFGADFMFFDGKYMLTVDYFENNQDGLILSFPTPPSFGVPGNSYSRNIGSLKNWGYEFAGEANLIRTKDFSLSIDANLSLIKNEITFLADNLPQIFENNYTITKVGESIRSVYGYDYVGVNTANGNPIYRKADGSLVQGNIPTSSYVVYNPENPGNISIAASLSSVTDKKIFGPSLPTFFGAFGTKLRYKDFDFSAMFRFSGGNYIMNRTRDDLTGQAFTNNGREILGRWQSADNPGDGWTPRLWFQGTNFVNISNQTNGRFVEKGDYLKLQNVTLGYTLPRRLVGRVGIESLRLFVQAQEWFTFTNYTGIDPEQESSGVDFNLTPRQKVLTFGLNLSL